jgi:hypothetical protein
LALSAPVDCAPLTALVPDQAPDAEQVVALVADQLNVELLPLATVLGLAASVTAGADELTDTIADWSALPPAPVQESMYVALAVNAPVCCEPLMLMDPDQAPDAVQEVALDVDQLSVDLLPLATVLGFAARLMLGTGWVTDTVADCDALVPLPAQVSV